MQDKQILIDGFYCAYRSAYAFQELRTKSGIKSGLIFGFIKTLIGISQKWPEAKLVVCWDTPSTWRREAYSEYKKNRTSTKTKQDRDQFYATSSFCKAVGITQALSDGHEADDVIGSLIDRSKLNIIFSRDRDFCQLVENGIVIVYSPKSGQVQEVTFTEQAVVEKFGVHPKKLLLYRSLRGDTSDNLPGLHRFPDKKIIELVQKHESIEDILCQPDPSVMLTENQKKALQDFHQQGPLNYKLMKIQTDIKVRQFQTDFRREAALKILDDFELKSLKSSLSIFEGQEDEGLMGLFDS